MLRGSRGSFVHGFTKNACRKALYGRSLTQRKPDESSCPLRKGDYFSPQRLFLGMAEPIRVFIVDDHPLLRQAVASLLRDEKDFSLCGEAEDLLTALPLIAARKPDVVILDITLKDSEGLDSVKAIKEQCRDTKILIFSGHDESFYAPRALRAGALGYVNKEEALDKLVTAVRRVATGRMAVSQDVETTFLQRLANGETIHVNTPVELLSDRELEVFTLFGRGHSPRQVAVLLGLSVKTVDAHRQKIKTKLNLNSYLEVTHSAVEWLKTKAT
jgi:DNA-binding NarL/FixJ family response regulator